MIVPSTLVQLARKYMHQKRPAKMAREARHFVDEAVLVPMLSSILDFGRWNNYCNTVENSRVISQIHAQKCDTGGAQNWAWRFETRPVLCDAGVAFLRLDLRNCTQVFNRGAQNWPRRFEPQPVLCDAGVLFLRVDLA